MYQNFVKQTLIQNQPFSTSINTTQYNSFNKTLENDHLFLTPLQSDLYNTSYFFGLKSHLHYWFI